MAESMPRRCDALYMGLFGEFENVGITIGPILGGVAWSLAGIQAAFYTYAVAALLASAIATVFVRRHSDATIMGGRMAEPSVRTCKAPYCYPHQSSTIDLRILH